MTTTRTSQIGPQHSTYVDKMFRVEAHDRMLAAERALPVGHISSWMAAKIANRKVG